MLTLRPYQEQSLKGLNLWFRMNKKGHPLLEVPTGGGKSLIIAEFIKRAPGARILILTHVKELIDQDMKELLNQWAEAPAGIYSAGLNSRDTEHPIIIAGIQSVYQRASDFAPFDLILIDECDLVPLDGEGRYRTFIDDALKINPHLRIIGLTATPYRLSGGKLHEGEGRIFTDIAYKVSIGRLVNEGWLVPLTTKNTKIKIDSSDVKIQAGEFNLKQLGIVCNDGELVREACKEIVRRGEDRKSWMLFAVNIEHAETIKKAMLELGIKTGIVTGKTETHERATTIAAFKSHELRALVNINVLSRGFNAPACDLLAILRPTESTSWHVQALGRGMRTSPGKDNGCLVLDFAGNIERHGPVDQVDPRGKRGAGEGEALVKECPECEELVAMSARICPDCGYDFPKPKLKHGTRASDGSVLGDGETWEISVTRVYYSRHKKKDKPDSMRVDYVVPGFGNHPQSEWICLEHEGYARKMAEQWWKLHCTEDFDCPDTVGEALEIAETGCLWKPKTLVLKQDGEWTRIVDRLDMHQELAEEKKPLDPVTQRFADSFKGKKPWDDEKIVF